MGLFSGIGKIVSSVGNFASGGLISGGLDLLGGVMNNNANSAEAAANRQFQADQTGTAYQRAVADLKAAGLNPMLAYTNGGASSGSGAQATMQNAVGSAVHTAMSARLNKAQVENMEAENENIREQKRKIQADTLAAISSANANSAFAQKANTDTALNKQAFARQAATVGASSSWMARKLSHFDRLMDSAGRLNPISGLFK